VNLDETREAEQFMRTAVDDFAQIVIAELSTRSLSADEQNKMQALTENWLKLVGEGRYASSWEELAEELKARFTRENWAATLQPALQQVGALKARRLKSIGYSDPEAETVAVEFDSSFAKAPQITEIVSLKLEKDGRWRIAGYSFK
jgi:Protein of unknown function (DUF4019)